MKLAGNDVFYWTRRCFFEFSPEQGAWMALDEQRGDYFEVAETDECEYEPFDSGYSVVDDPPNYFKDMRYYD